jgi:hypothetical protein
MTHPRSPAGYELAAPPGDRDSQVVWAEQAETHGLRKGRFYRMADPQMARLRWELVEFAANSDGELAAVFHTTDSPKYPGGAEISLPAGVVRQAMRRD